MINVVFGVPPSSLPLATHSPGSVKAWPASQRHRLMRVSLPGARHWFRRQSWI